MTQESLVIEREDSKAIKSYSLRTVIFSNFSSVSPSSSTWAENVPFFFLLNSWKWIFLRHRAGYSGRRSAVQRIGPWPSFWAEKHGPKVLNIKTGRNRKIHTLQSLKKNERRENVTEIAHNVLQIVTVRFLSGAKKAIKLPIVFSSTPKSNLAHQNPTYSFFLSKARRMWDANNSISSLVM